MLTPRDTWHAPAKSPHGGMLEVLVSHGPTTMSSMPTAVDRMASHQLQPMREEASRAGRGAAMVVAGRRT